MKYGYFNDNKREYVITTPKTPIKWINYVGNLNFGGFVDQTGGGVICKGDPALNRITKYIPQMPASDFKGETMYIRIKKPEGFKIFSPYFVPTLDKYDKYECHVGLLYTRIISEFYGIQTDITIFVPIGGTQVIRDIKITNLNKETVELDAIPVVEYSHPDALKQLTNADWVPQTMTSKLASEKNGMKVIIQYPFMFRDIKINYFTSNFPVSSFETDRRMFLGDNEYGTWARPLALENAELSSYEALRGDSICALLHHLGKIEPGKTVRFVTQLGQESKLEEALPLIEKYRSTANVDEAFAGIKTFWDGYLDTLQVDTPDASMNSMLNVHNPRQCYITKNWSRDLSLYQLGYGGRGLGFRDSSQDLMGVIAHMPEESKGLIKKILSVQKGNGSAMHQFMPLTMEASVGDSHEKEDRPKYYGDDHLWIILTVCSYLKETGDIKFLEEVIPYYDKDKQGKPVSQDTVLDHLKKAIEFTHGDKGKHGLPLLGFADWNDTVNLPTGAESLFVANQFGKALLEMIELMNHLGDQETANKYKTYYDEMKASVNKHAWDGEWFVRYFDHDGEPLGSKKNEHGKIYINSQSWAVISGFADHERACKSLESVNKHLNTKNGMKLSAPGFNGFEPEKGGITTYPPGAKENGGIFLHTNPWVMIAETIMGNGERAFQYYQQINPAAKNDTIDEFECDPYVYPQNILGDEHPLFGLARNHWLSGTSSWTYQAGTKYILGILPTFEGLLINPCIPKTWDGFKATRVFRGITYKIEVKNPNHVSKGIKSVKADGKEIASKIVPVFSDGKEHSVEIIMG